MSNISQAKEALRVRLLNQRKSFNEGLNTAIAVVKETKGAGMMFPSGKSFAQLVCDGLEPLLRPVKHE